ncbi:MAG: type II secretion system protein [Kiritimatiellaeota bacterium]|nr:type II secretion system protein [Kiritimatiellota bacterium]
MTFQSLETVYFSADVRSVILNAPFPFRRARAFTLIELLVVIGIIAIPLAPLVPTLTGIREKTYKLTCMSNQRQLALAVIHCAGDHEGLLPYPNWGVVTTWGVGWAYDPAQPLTGSPSNLLTGLLWQYIKDYRVYRCPKDPANRLPANACAEWKITSYIMNGAACSYSSGHRPNLFSQFRHDDALFWENNTDTFTFGGDLSNYPLEGGKPTLECRHQGGGVYACFDAHAEWISSNDFATAAKDTTTRNRFWCAPPPSVNGH